MIINATHIGEKLDGIGRFSLILAKFFLKNNQEIIINETATIHFSKEELQHIKIVDASLSPDFGFKGHFKRLLFTNKLKGDIFNLSQLEVSFFNKNQIVVVHDIIPLLFPKYHLKQYYFFKYLLPYVLKNRTKKIIVVSYHTKELLLQYYGVKNIEVIHNGIILPKYENIEKEDYILFVGRDSPTKNIDNMIKSFIELKKDMKFKNYKLYIVGFKKNFKRDDIITLGYVDDNKLDKLYKKAKVFFVPTLYEGFGYPVIEAMSRGTAVVTSKVSSLPEICKDNAIYINPYDIMDMSFKLKYILSNDELRKEYENNGLKLSKQFDINLMLKKYVNLIKEF